MRLSSGEHGLSARPRLGSLPGLLRESAKFVGSEMFAGNSRRTTG